MNQASAGGGAGAPTGILGGDLHMLMEDLESTIKKMNSPILSAGEAHSTLGSMNANAAAFGGVEAAKALASRHGEVLGVFTSTIKALQGGLQDCQTNLRECVQAHKENDQIQAERLTNLTRQLDGAASGTRHAYQSGVRHQGDTAHQGGANSEAQGAPGATGGKGLGE